MLSVLARVWTYREEILLAVQLLNKMRKSAAQITREYIRRQIRTKLRHAIHVVLAQISLFVTAYWLVTSFPSPGTRCFASLVLWGVTIYNLTELLFITIPELHALHRTLRSKVGYTVKYFLEVSLVTECLRFNVVFLAVCLALGVSTRTAIGSRFSYVKPWAQLIAYGPRPHRRPPRYR